MTAAWVCEPLRSRQRSTAARAHWPWLGGIFVFNLDFNPPRRALDACYDEQGWFAVQGHAAEAALEAMPKAP